MKIAILGTSNIAETRHAPAIAKLPDVHLWSVHSRNLDSASAFADKHGAQSSTPAYTDLDALLSDPELDAVLVTTPDKVHAEQVIAAAKHGKHVLCEKPMATSLEETREMIDACELAGVKLGIAYQMRFHAGVRAVHDMIQSGRLGPLRHMRVQWTFQAQDDSNWRASDEVGKWWGLAGVGTHSLDLIRWFMVPTCGEIKNFTSIVTRPVWGNHDENALLAMAFENGATAEMMSSVLYQGPRMAEIYGRDGYVIMDEALGQHGEGSIRTHEGEFHFKPVDPFAGQLADFAAAIRDDRPPEVDGQEGRKNVEYLLKTA
ncbi:MAG: Gfo/Idh/MocA family oxidoreductase [Bacteroidota bacterium]